MADLNLKSAVMLHELCVAHRYRSQSALDLHPHTPLLHTSLFIFNTMPRCSRSTRSTTRRPDPIINHVSDPCKKPARHRTTEQQLVLLLQLYKHKTHPTTVEKQSLADAAWIVIYFFFVSSHSTSPNYNLQAVEIRLDMVSE